MSKIITVLIFAMTLSACQSMISADDRTPPTAKEVAKAAKQEQKKKEDNNEAPNPVKCQQAKLNLVEVEGTQDVGMINLAKDKIHQYCDDF